MMMCSKCHDTEGPFVCDVKTGKCLCEDCYTIERVATIISGLIKDSSNKNNLSMKAVAIMDSIETAVFDELGLN